MDKFDIHWKQDGPSLDYHFCRDWDEDGGCYGTNKDHGLTLDDAVGQVADYYDGLAKAWREKTHPDVKYFTDGYAEEDAQ